VQKGEKWNCIYIQSIPYVFQRLWIDLKQIELSCEVPAYLLNKCGFECNTGFINHKNIL